MPASSLRLRTSLKILAILLTLVLFHVPAHADNAGPQATSQSQTSVNLLINYGNGTLEWHNRTQVPANWSFFNVTVADTNGNLGAVFFQSFGSHFVYLINGVGCATVFGCDETWSLWILNGACWGLSDVGPDQIPVAEGRTVAWFFVPLASFGQNPPTGVSCINVGIDVKPGSDTNPVNVRSPGLIPVAVLTTAAFNVSSLDRSTVRFGRTGTEAAPVHSSLQDVNGDGVFDLVFQFKIQDTGIRAGDTEARLTGRTTDGTLIIGTDSIRAFFPGDVNGDLKVDILDAAALAVAYGSTPEMQTWNPRADFDGNGLVDILDAALLAGYYGQHA